MKKKLLLIPIVLMSCSIAGCEYDTYIVPLGQWMEHNGPMHADPHFSVQTQDEEKSGGFIDYEEYVGKAIRERVRDAEEVTKSIKKSVTTDNYVSYRITCAIRKMDKCTIYVYDNGYITTYAYAYTDIINSFFGRPKDQKLVYKIEEGVAKEIIDIATNRYVEIKEQMDADNAAVEEAGKIENVLNTFEQSEEPLNLWYNFQGSGVQYHADFPDTNREFLDGLKTTEFEEAEDNFVWGRIIIEEVKYRINNDLVLGVCNHIERYEETNIDIVSVTVKNKGKYADGYNCTFYYKIDPEQGHALVQLANRLFLEYNAETI